MYIVHLVCVWHHSKRCACIILFNQYNVWFVPSTDFPKNFKYFSSFYPHIKSYKAINVLILQMRIWKYRDKATCLECTASKWSLNSNLRSETLSHYYCYR